MVGARQPECQSDEAAEEGGEDGEVEGAEFGRQACGEDTSGDTVIFSQSDNAFELGVSIGVG